MADVEFEDFEGGFDTPYGPGRPERVARLINLAGALTSVALILGVGVWGYKIAVRDVTGIPVVRALDGPMRIAPETPGGDIAAHQGLSVNRVAAEGLAAPVPDRLVLAPRPVDLALEDIAGLAAEAPVTAVAATAHDLVQAGFTPDAARLMATAIGPEAPLADLS
ncbi:MAG: SPOR domain-containing protein, partial [Paracoccaceae bacterium]|nr:SPOR domain-containing protein [Paracoccaceae bacterium]